MRNAPPQMLERDPRVRDTDLLDAWPVLLQTERADGFLLLSREHQERLIGALPAGTRVELILALPRADRRRWICWLASNDAVDLLRELSIRDWSKRGQIAGPRCSGSD